MYAIRTYTCNADDWTAITPPYISTGFSIRNAGEVDVLIRSDKTDEGTEDVLRPGYAEIVANSNSTKTFGTGRPLFWVKSTSGTVTLKGRFVC